MTTRGMTGSSRVLVYLVLAGPALVVLVVLLAMGPLGWVAAGTIAFGTMIYRAVREDPAEQTPDRASCLNCGAPNDPDAGQCDYCDATL
jgi:Flp pilus assembly protein TadB